MEAKSHSPVGNVAGMSGPVSTTDERLRDGKAITVIANSVEARLNGVRVAKLIPAPAALTMALAHVLKLYGPVAQW